MPGDHSSLPRPSVIYGISARLNALLLCAWALCPASLAADSAQLRVGVARKQVTPSPSIPYLTSSGNATNAPFQGVHDDLFARALVLDDGRQAVAVLAVDSLGYDNAVLGPGRDFTRELRQRIAARTALQSGAVMLAASHTHSAPETIGLTPLGNTPGAAVWLEQHLGQLVDTVVEAWRGRTPARAFHGASEIPGLTRCRRIALRGGGLNRNGPLPADSLLAAPWKLDETLSVLYFETENGRPLGALMNFTAHPVVAMLLPQVSADYPGAATAAVERALPGAVCLFTNGCAGNVNSIHVATNFDDVAVIGRRLGDGALSTIARSKPAGPLADTTIALESQACELAPRPTLSLADARRQAEARPTALNARLYRLARKLDEGPIRAEVQAMALGPIRWLSLPGEPFVETGLALKQAGATFVVGYANGYVGYLPIRRAYDEGGYEVDPGPWSRVAPGSAERLQAIGEMLLEQLNRAGNQVESGKAE